MPTKSTKNAGGGVEPISLEEMIDKCLTAIENEECRKYLENRTTYESCFFKANDVPYFEINKNANIATSMFSYATITEFSKLDIGKSNLQIGIRMFNECKNLIKVQIDIKKFYNISSMFYNCVSLVDVGTLDFSGIPQDNSDRMGACFYNCKSLEKIKVVSQSLKRSLSFAWSPLLSAESVQSIIDGLAIVTTAQTITFHKNIALTDEQKQIINEKGWTLVQA